MNVRIVSHQMAESFFASSSNIPWIKNPVCYIEDDTLYIVYDSYDRPQQNFCELTYVKSPNHFVKDLDSIEHSFPISYFSVNNAEPAATKALYEFECNGTVAEELISLAVAFALENVESQRLNSKLNMRGLEA